MNKLILTQLTATPLIIPVEATGDSLANSGHCMLGTLYHFSLDSFFLAGGAPVVAVFGMLICHYLIFQRPKKIALEC